jgi:hypothetical protein
LPVSEEVAPPALTPTEEELEPASAVVAEESVTESAARAYTIQFMALQKQVDLQRFREIPDIAVTYNGDRWYRYTLGATTEVQEAERIRSELVAKGYRDAFIRKKSIVPMFSIQVMAVPGPVVDLAVFSSLPEISARKGEDSFCRYTTGEYETREEALVSLKKVQESGYPGAFITKISNLQ